MGKDNIQQDPTKHLQLPKSVLVASALAAAGLNQFLLLFPWALLLGVPTLLYRNVFLMWVAGLAFLLFAWILQPTTRRDYRIIDRKDAPELYRCVDTISAKLNSPRIDFIAWDKELNAAAVELNRGISTKPTKRILLLGLPLLSILTRAELEAVVAHEMGHFSRAHGRFGHWLYRTRTAWIEHLHLLDDSESSAYERAGAAFAQRFVPWFSKHSHAYSRQCEFEADALSVKVVTPEIMGAALTRIALANIQSERQSRSGLTQYQLQWAQAPKDWLCGDHSDLKSGLELTPTEQDKLFVEDASQTHPPLPRRLTALGLPADLGLRMTEAMEPCAGEGLLGQYWDTLTEVYDTEWANSQRITWPMQHALLKVVDARLQTLRAANVQDEERLRYEHVLENDQEVLAIGEQSRTQNPMSNYRLAECLMKAGQAKRAAELLLQCIGQAAEWAVPARALLADYELQVFSNADDRIKNQALLQKALERRATASTAMWKEAEVGRFQDSMLDAAQRQALSVALALHPAIQSSWVVGLTHRLDDKRTYRSVMLLARLNPELMSQMDLNEDGVDIQIRAVLRTILDPHLIVQIWLSFTTEQLPPPVLTSLSKLEGSQLSGPIGDPLTPLGGLTQSCHDKAGNGNT